MVLAIIPARGGSKGIPRKNVRIMNGKPLIYYAIRHALDCPYIDDVIVSSDDEEILGIANMYGVYGMNRDSALAQDAVTLDPVIYDALVRRETQTGNYYDTVVTLQATSPLLSVETLNAAMETFFESGLDTMISAVNKPHLSWTRRDGVCIPNYEARRNRQQLPPNYLEAGAFLITKRACMSETNRIGANVSVYEMPEKEATDIDNYADWIVCEQELSKKRILFRVDGYRTLGMGHIYRCLTLAYSLTGHDILFVTRSDCKEGYQKLLDSYMKVEAIQTQEDVYRIAEQWKPDVIVQDCLNTEVEYMQRLKKYAKRVVTIEDIGAGADVADATINALYEDGSKGEHYYWGEKYVCLKDEFLIASCAPYHETVQKVVVLFGGSDPSDFTYRVYKMAERLHAEYPDMQFEFVLGAGYDNSIHHLTDADAYHIRVLSDIKRVSDALMNADLAITSQGRTVYELAAMGVPAIVMAQNERETKHTFAQMQNGFLNLGMGVNVNDETLEKTFRFVVDTPQIRAEMRKLMLQHDLRKGIDRVKQIILQED